ncbi:probable cytochrome P450 12a4, mitochondrial isoform X2 [Amphibalanus amphitrite]|uniref:probable cytochrome P450 12a4, mitochondrial isoform X2 n=1 Tax=Amphibalanus amphitrite TaxID=1232801 RepID=UPI001C91FB5E|nr:probable cytochrome P450 12a4, mitochondrial isoform X2 [Amphibalanus amphitrite]
MKLASIVPKWSPVHKLSRRLRPLPDLDPVEAGPTPQAVLPAELTELAAARPFASLGGPAAWPVVGSAGAFIGVDRTRLDQLFGRLRERFGDLYRLKQPLRGTETVVAFSSQDAEKVFRTEGIWPIRPGLYPVRMYNQMHGLNNGLLPGNGQEWSDLRGTVQQAFLRANALQPFMHQLETSAADLVAALSTDRDDQRRLRRDFMQHAQRTTVDVIQKVSCGSAAFRDPDERSLLLHNIGNFFSLTADLEMHINTWRYVATPQWKRLTHALDYFNLMADKWITTALSQDTASEPNMLAMLLEKGLTRPQLKALVVDFFIGGVDTTSMSLTCLIYHLATNPECQERAYQEILQSAPPPGELIAKEHTGRLNYMRACVKENLRMNAPILGIARKLGKDIVLGDHRIPKGKVVFMVNSMTSRSGSEFCESSRFLPERWLRCPAAEGAPAPAATTSAPSPFASLPFSHGPRMCIGRRLSEHELLVFATRILQRFRVEYSGRPLRLKMQLNCKPDAPIQFTFVEREAEQAVRQQERAAATA